MPFLPQVFRNFPSLSNFMMRALPTAVPPPVWPSPTKISPLAATATSVGRVELILSGPGDAFLSERHQHFAIRATEFEHLMAAVVGNPEIAVLVHRQLVRARRTSRAKVFQQLAGRVELEDRRDRRHSAQRKSCRPRPKRRSDRRPKSSRPAPSSHLPSIPTSVPPANGRSRRQAETDSADRCARRGATRPGRLTGYWPAETSAARRGRSAAAWWARRTNSPAAPAEDSAAATAAAAESSRRAIASAIANDESRAILIFIVRPRRKYIDVRSLKHGDTSTLSAKCRDVVSS